jgi:hypothetical protein
MGICFFFLKIIGIKVYIHNYSDCQGNGIEFMQFISVYIFNKLVNTANQHGRNILMRTYTIFDFSSEGASE